MSELRQNLMTREWVIMAPERLKGKKPEDLCAREVLDLSEYEKNCPFCPGNDDRYENIEIDRISGGVHGWLARSIENKYKIFGEHPDCTDRPRAFDSDGIYFSYDGCGSHDLVIESSLHNIDFGLMSAEQASAPVSLWLNRFNSLQQNPNNLLTVIFKNHGPESGASQRHPHSQIVAMRVVPNFIRFLLEEAQRYFDNFGVCVFCRIMEHELSERNRVIFENRHFFSYVPYAASVPYEMHIIPKTHDALFGDMHVAEKEDFCDCLVNTLGALRRALNNPDYNLILRNPPYPLSGVPYYHWHIQIVPHIVTPGGFEMGSHMQVNVVLPEDAAAHLRENVSKDSS